MTELRGSLNERRDEFATHHALAVALEGRIFSGDVVSIGETELSVRHLLCMKSGLIVHLYNIVEATMSRAMELLGDAVGSVPPHKWAECTLREWLREYVVARVDGTEDTRLSTVHDASINLLLAAPLGRQQFKKPSGTWTDKLIAMFATRMNIPFKLPEAMWRRIASRPDYGDKTPLEFLAERRNAIAHGRRTFEEGAKDLTLAKIRELADVTLDYLELTVDAFQDFVDKKLYEAVE